MNFKELVQNRKSIRNYSDKKVEQEKIEYILDCARLAPSAVNKQPWQFFVITKEEDKEKLLECYPRDWYKTAPMSILACADISQSWKRPHDNKDHADIDVAIAVEHICLAATEQGLGTCWVCHFDVEKCKQLFDLPENLIPTVIIPIGYPEGETKSTPRKELNEIVTYK